MLQRLAWEIPLILQRWISNLWHFSPISAYVFSENIEHDSSLSKEYQKTPLLEFPGAVFSNRAVITMIGTGRSD